MKHLYSAFLALLVVGSAGLTAAQADGYRYDAGCNCNRPVSSTRTVREAPRVVVNTRVVNHNRTVERHRRVEENQLVVHVRPVIHREVVVHREHVHVRNVVTRQVNTINRFREEDVRGGTVNRYVRTTSASTIYRTVPGTNCNCGGSERVAGGSYREGSEGGEGYREATYRY
jgi:hypothetical protein